jgi:tol-pal system protein YbgF
VSMRAGAFLAVAAAGMLAAAGCATRGDVDFLSEEHQRIAQRQNQIDERITALEETMARLQDLLQGIRADFRADLGAMRAQVAALESAVRGTESRLEQIRNTVPRPAPAPSDTTGGADVGAVDELTLYNSAVADYSQQRLDLALRGFQEYLRLFPSGPSASDAQFWIGQIAFDQRRFDVAIAEFRRVVEDHPQSSKAPLALRKIGDAYREMGQEDRARDAYRQLIRLYPNSQDAQSVRQEVSG